MDSNKLPEVKDLHDIKKITPFMSAGVDKHGKTWKIKITKDQMTVVGPMTDSRTEPLDSDAKKIITGEEIWSIYFLAQVQQEREAPDHWSLFIGSEGERGRLIQVMGDAFPGMHQPPVAAVTIGQPEVDEKQLVNIFASSSIRYAEPLGKCKAADANTIIALSKSVKPPVAPKHNDANENCQHWLVQVVHLLEEHKLVEPGSTKLLQERLGKHWDEYPKK